MTLERFWSLLLAGEASSLVTNDCAWDDPIHDRGAPGVAIPRFTAWMRARASAEDIRPLRTTESAQRVVVEHVVGVRDALVWNQEKQRGEKVARTGLATAVVGDKRGDRFGAIRVYFGTWSVLDGLSRLRAGPIAPDERVATRAAIEAFPIVKRYFDGLAAGDSSIIELFEEDGYFREPANNFMCGRDQLVPHFQHILEIGGVDIELWTAIRQDNRLGLELQTITWGKKVMERPQAGFAIYELGPNGKLSGARVYDSTVPP